MSREDKLDQLLRERFDNYAPDPPEGVWNSVLADMSARKTRKMAVLVRWAAAAAILLIATTTILLIDSPAEVQFASEQQPVTGSPQMPTGETRQSDPAGYNGRESSVELAQTDFSMPNQNSVRKPAFVLSEKTAPTNDNNVSNYRDVRLASLQSRSARDLFAGRATNESQRLIIPADRLTNEDRMIIAANMVDRNDAASFDSRGWKVGVHVSPAFSSHEANHSARYASNMTYSGDVADANMGGGISVQYKTNSRWRLESGMYYSKTGGNSENSLGSRSSNADFYGAPVSAEKYFNTLVNSDRGQLEMNSTAGVIRFNGTPAQAEMITMPVSGFGLTTAMLSPGEFTQVFDFVEIPLFVRYLLFDSRLDVEWVGGVSSNLTVGNNVYMESNNSRERVGSTEDISTFSVAASTGLGMAYALGKNLSISVEPRFTYYLSSINHSGDVSFRPWRLGVYTGLSYEF